MNKLYNFYIPYKIQPDVNTIFQSSTYLLYYWLLSECVLLCSIVCTTATAKYCDIEFELKGRITKKKKAHSNLGFELEHNIQSQLLRYNLGDNKL